LEAKLNIEKQPDWLKTHSIIKLGANYGSEYKIEALQYQLTERTKFVKPKDDIVADMYYLLGVETYNLALKNSACLRGMKDQVVDAFNKSLLYGELRKKEIKEINIRCAFTCSCSK